MNRNVEPSAAQERGFLPASSRGTSFITPALVLILLLVSFPVACLNDTEPKPPPSAANTIPADDMQTTALGDASRSASDGRVIPSETIAFRVGATRVDAHVYWGTKSGALLFNMHDNENTSVRAAKAVVMKNGATLVELRHTGERLITFELGGKRYTFDPNRIFTRAGISATLAKYGHSSPEAEAEVDRFAGDLIDSLFSGRETIVAMHNNTDGKLSVLSYQKGGEYENDAEQVFVDPMADTDDFFYVTDKGHFNTIVTKGFNVVLQDNAAVTDDGSLSVYCGQRQIRYINVEAEHGHEAEQVKMLNAFFVGEERHAEGAPAAFGPLLFPAYRDVLEHRGLRFDSDLGLAIRVVSAFGAVFVAEGKVTVPRVWMFPDEEAVSSFHESLSAVPSRQKRPAVELQRAALVELEMAREEAVAAGFSITQAGPLAARRGYEDTVGLWESRVIPGLRHWVSAGRLEQTEADRILALETRDQIGAILALEEEGIWFARGRDKSILYSVAAPGTSQHLSMLALDIKEYENREVRSILARHGWYQTVYSDLPHFTFLGIPESELPDRGLEARTYAGRTFWVVGMLIRPRGVDDQIEVSETCAF